MSQYALVTGGSRGIGRAICLQLAKDGFSILVNYRSNVQAAETVVQDIFELGGYAELLQFDVTDCISVRDSLSSWQKEHENDYIEVLVNNAGIRDDAMIALLNSNQWRRVIATSLDGFYYTTSEVIKKMIAKRSGKIINIASISGLIGLPGQTNYSAAKGGLISATKALAKEVATRGITVNAISPGFIQTDMTDDLDRPSIVSQIPMRRIGMPEDVAFLVSFLASSRAAYITGEVISVSGGL